MKKTLKTSTAQAAVLLQFQSLGEELSGDAFKLALELDRHPDIVVDSILCRIIDPLVHGKVLIALDKGKVRTSNDSEGLLTLCSSLRSVNLLIPPFSPVLSL